MNLTGPQRQLQYFFFGQHFSDGLRTTVAVLLPALVGAQTGWFAQGLLASTGALCLSFADLPGPARHRRSGLLAALALVGATAVGTGLLVPSPWALGLEIAGLSFGLTMLLVWGARAGAVGTAALLSTVLLLAHPPAPAEILPHAALLLAGGAWYTALALLLNRVLPYRAAQQTLGESLHALADFLRLKAEFYDLATDLPADFRRLVAQQARVSEAQEAGRELLFRTQQIVSETTPTGRRLVLAFVEGVDLYEHVSASSFDYAQLRATFGGTTGVLAEIGACLVGLADEVDALGAAILASRPPPAAAPAARTAALAAVQAAIAALEADVAWAGKTRPLRKIFVNLRDIHLHTGRLRRYFEGRTNPATFQERVSGVRCWVLGIGYWVLGLEGLRTKRVKAQHLTPNTQNPTPNTQHPIPDTQHPTPKTKNVTPPEPPDANIASLGPAGHAQFVASTALHWAAFPQNLTLQSAIFRHAVRMLLACVFAYGLGETVWRGTHSYWVLLTVAVMLKPGFSLTKARNLGRVGGTLAGGLLGGGLLALIHQPEIRFGILVVFMLLAYTFQRARYGVSVVFLTAYLLILFSFLGLNYVGVVQERIIDTLLGCAIAFAASYFLFPRWESDQLRPPLVAALRTNQAYLAQLAERLAGRPVPALAYRLRRKEVYVAAANLQAAFQRMLAEPKSKQHHAAQTHDFVVLNHVLSAQIAALSQGLPLAPAGAAGPPAPPQTPATAAPALAPEARRALRSAQAALARALLALAPDAAPPETPPAPAAPTLPADPALAEQLAYLQKVSTDLARVSEALAAGN